MDGRPPGANSLTIRRPLYEVRRVTPESDKCSRSAADSPRLAAQSVAWYLASWHALMLLEGESDQAISISHIVWGINVGMRWLKNLVK